MQKIVLRSPQPLTVLIKLFEDKLSSSEFAEMVTISVDEYRQVVVKIRKVGTSTILFATEETATSCVLTLKSADVSFFHKKHIGEVYAWISGVVTEMGGQVEV